MMDEPDKDTKVKYQSYREKAIMAFLQSSLAYVLKSRDFDGENYYIEDIAEILSDFQTLILSTVNELIESSFAVMKEFGKKYSQ